MPPAAPIQHNDLQAHLPWSGLEGFPFSGADAQAEASPVVDGASEA